LFHSLTFLLVSISNDSKFPFLPCLCSFCHKPFFACQNRFLIVFFLSVIPEKTKIKIDDQCVEPANQSLDDAREEKLEVVSEVNVDDNEPNTEDMEGEDLKAVSEENVDNEPNTKDMEDDPDTREEQNTKETLVPDNVQNPMKRVAGKRKLQIQGKWRGVDPVVFFKDETIINSIRDFYGIDERFPFNNHLVTRNSDTNHVKRIYYISKSVKDVLELNFKVGQQLKITSIGLKMFVSIFYSELKDIVFLRTSILCD